MSEDIFSTYWYKVADLRPRIRGHSRISRHHYRGQRWYVLLDQSTGNSYRFSPAAYQIIGLMDGRRTVEELWHCAGRLYGDEAPGQGEVIGLLSKLYSADMLVCAVPADTRALLERQEKSSRAKARATLRSPFFLRLPLVDPDRFFTRTIAPVRALFSRTGLAIWCATILIAGVLAWLHWQEMTVNIVDRVFTRNNLFLLWLIYPAVKGIHELAHGYAVKRWGGEVHEMGVMLLVFMPIPYIDASSSSAFRSRSQRLTVGAAGIGAELFLAALALFAWISLEPGIVRTIAFNIMLIGGVSTLLFNGNPLLRYDGYYILSDLLDIPNLAQRGAAYVEYLATRHLFGLTHGEPPYLAPGERFWLLTYTIASSGYRLLVYGAIILFVASKFFFIGVLLGIWGFFGMILIPAIRKTRAILSLAHAEDKRGRFLALTLLPAIGLLLFLFLIPLPHASTSEGVIWVPEESLVRAGTSGIVTRVVVQPGSRVAPGETLIECEDSVLATEYAILQSQLREYQLRYSAALPTDQTQARIIGEERGNIEGQLARAGERLKGLQITSPTSGTFVLPRAPDLVGRYLRQGDLLGYVLDDGGSTVRIAVSQHTVDRIRKETRAVTIRVVSHIDRLYPGRIIREIPGGIDRLPSSALGSDGGGKIAVDPTDSGSVKTFERMFQFDLALNEPLEKKMIGTRVLVRLDHGHQPVGFRIYHAIQRFARKRFHV